MSRMGALPARPRVGLRSARILVPLVLGRNHPLLGSILPAALAFGLLTASVGTAPAQSRRSYANARF